MEVEVIIEWWYPYVMFHIYGSPPRLSPPLSIIIYLKDKDKKEKEEVIEQHRHP